MSLLVSLDVGGTLAHTEGRNLAAILAAASPLDPQDARRIMRHRLHTQPSITVALVDEVCTALKIPVSAFPRHDRPAPLRLMPDALPALRAMHQHADLVTLSNVTCIDASTDQLRNLLSPWVITHFPSCHLGYAKPNKAAFTTVARACGTTTQNMVHIGDDWECDILGARSVGATAIWISRGKPVPRDDLLVDPDVLVAADLATASQHVTDLATRRQS